MNDDEDTRSWAEKRIDDRRAGRGLPAGGSSTSNRLTTAALLAVVGVLLVVLTESVGVVIGVVALVGAAYQLVVAAISTGVREGRDDG